ncbi:MAG: hypothetical protein COA78_21485 [Blastopirellula sp.]|nr:MAG: hypothetical protein COA78_21485 [Blastopirellula sp.]
MTDQPDNPYTSPLGLSAEESPRVRLQNQQYLNPISKGTVGTVFFGMVSGAFANALMMVLTAPALLFLLILMENSSEPDEFLFVVIILFAIYGIIVGTVSGAIHGMAWQVIQDRPNQFVPMVALGTALSILSIEGPQVFMLIENQDLVTFLWFGAQSIGIFVAVLLLNMNLRKYVSSRNKFN